MYVFFFIGTFVVIVAMASPFFQYFHATDRLGLSAYARTTF